MSVGSWRSWKNHSVGPVLHWLVWWYTECTLSLQDDILLEVEDLYYLLLQFPKTVNEDTASAIFNKKKQRLTMTVDVLWPGLCWKWVWVSQNWGNMRAKHKDKCANCKAVWTHCTMLGLKMPANTLTVLWCAAVFVWLHGLSAKISWLQREPCLSMCGCMTGDV